MKGFLYKEIKQNRLYILLTVALAPVMVYLPLVLNMIATKSVGKESFYHLASEGVIVRVLTITVGYCCAYALQSFVLKGEDRKMWGFFVGSAPNGIRNFIGMKYLFTAGLNIMFSALTALCDLILVFMMKYLCGLNVQFMWEIYLSMAFLMMLWSAFEMPCTIRFGEKKGTILRMILLVALLAIFIGVTLLWPDAVEKFRLALWLNADLPDIMRWATPIVSLGGFVLSWFISCKVYLKGVMNCYK